MRVLVVERMGTLYENFLKKMYNVDTIEEVVYDHDNPDKILTGDLVLLTGGADVNPRYYKESTGRFTHVNEKRCEREFGLLRRVKNSMPKLGICRGAQILTVYNGGALVQHVDGHNGTHNIDTFENSFSQSDPQTYSMTSSHHQMMYPYRLPATYYKLVAWTRHFLSSTYLNGKNVEIKLPEHFLEPEIVYYKGKNSLCIQGHPEYTDMEKNSLNFVKSLIKKYLK
ncbi:MAG: gamma-glutamyl-gamma-aminobutyrate hydrolase family protein [Gammaproteobacteria bacterium]|nr:gamma-glutamyl-gamma-aminobutyrate hydrolase family protein [Gammaproteobacteria bacterium]